MCMELEVRLFTDVGVLHKTNDIWLSSRTWPGMRIRLGTGYRTRFGIRVHPNPNPNPNPNPHRKPNPHHDPNSNSNPNPSPDSGKPWLSIPDLQEDSQCQHQAGWPFVRVRVRVRFRES